MSHVIYVLRGSSTHEIVMSLQWGRIKRYETITSCRFGYDRRVDGGVHPPHPRLVTQDRNMVNIPIPQVRSSQLRTRMEMEGFLL